MKMSYWLWCYAVSYTHLGHIELPPYPNQNFKAIEPCCSCGSCECLDYRIRNDVFEMTKKEFSELSSKEIKDYLINHPEKFEIFTYYIGKIINLLVNLLNPDLIIFTGKFKEDVYKRQCSISSGKIFSTSCNEIFIVSKYNGLYLSLIHIFSF